MRVAVLSATEVGYDAVRALLELGAEVVAMVAVDDAYILDSGLDRKYFVDLSPLSVEFGIPLYTTGSGDDAGLCRTLAERAPDLIVCAGWPFYVPPSILDLPRLGVIGAHPSRLPERRGASTFSWTLIDDLPSTAVSLYFLSEEMHAGDLIGQLEVPLEPDDTVGMLLARFNRTTVELLRRYYQPLEAETAPRAPQEPARATYTRARKPADNRILWRDSSRRIYNLIRAVTKPFSGAHTTLRGEPLTIWKARPIFGECFTDFSQPGMIAQVYPHDRAFAVITGDNALLVTLVQPMLGEITSASRFAEDVDLTAGEMLGEREDSA
ncbi:hypothetical protein HS125_14745 [bacterium]|nr:hypothetical protein [bacterium]